MSDPFILIVNPKAGSGRAGRQQQELESALRAEGAEFDTRYTERPGHARELTREALLAGAPGVAVVGGDGTLSEAAGGFFDSEGEPIAHGRWLGPLPCGTGGDFRKTAGFFGDVSALAKRLIAAKPRPIDVGWIEYENHQGKTAAQAFLNVASFGLGGLVDQAVENGPKWLGGRLAFGLGTVRSALNYRGQTVRLRFTDTTGTHVREAHIANVAIANGRFFGGGMQIAPQAILDDHVLDLVSIERPRRRDQLLLLPALYKGTLLEQPGVFHTTITEVFAESLDDRPVLLDIDGEAPGRLPARFSIRSGVVQLR